MDHANMNVKQTDAGDRTPKRDSAEKKTATTQDAPNYKERTDKGQALPMEDVNSANDE